MASSTERSEDERALPRPELNPLVNPLLADNMGRWAEVYFTSPPEKREEAVIELLRELEAFLDAGAPPVYVSFGSMPLRQAEEVARSVVEAVRARGRRVLLGTGGGPIELGLRFTSGESGYASTPTAIWKRACGRSRRGVPGRAVNAAARAARTARGRASIPARCTPEQARGTTRGSRWPAAPALRSTSGSLRAAGTRPGT